MVECVSVAPLEVPTVVPTPALYIVKFYQLINGVEGAFARADKYVHGDEKRRLQPRLSTHLGHGAPWLERDDWREV